MKRKTLWISVFAMVLLCAMVLTVSAEATYKDVSKKFWGYKDVMWATQEGVMNGTGDGSTFSPNDDMTRAMLATVLWRIDGEEAPKAGGHFTDVKKGKWFTDAVNWAAENDIVNGVGEGTFAPNQSITREQIVTILYRYAELKAYDISARSDFEGLGGVNKLHSWAETGMRWAVAEGLVNGVEKNGQKLLAPRDSASRAQVAAILHRFMENIAVPDPCAKGHTEVIDPSLAATCTKEGLTEGSHCSVCGTVLVRQKVIAKWPHYPVTDPAVRATCTKEGLTEGSHCSVCETVLVAQTTVPATEVHLYGEWDILDAPAKGKEGLKRRNCTNCTAFQERVMPALTKTKYDSNPLIAENKKINTEVLPSFDIDTTNFSKNDIKLKDLKGKSLLLLTAESQGNFFYTDKNGERIDEWQWFELLKNELGLQVKYIESHWHDSMKLALTYMNAGKSLDIIPTSGGGFPQFLNLSQPLDPHANMAKVVESPAVDEMVLKQTRYGGGYRCISPIGAVDVLIYNQTLVEELGLKDPHALWENDRWNWNEFRSFLAGVPSTTANGKPLYAYREAVNSWWSTWPTTNGVQALALDNQSNERLIINNWNDQRVLEAVTFFSDTMKSIKDASTGKDGETLSTLQSYERLFNGTMVMSSRATLFSQAPTATAYAKSCRYNWVPYPAAPNAGGRTAAISMGYSMMLPRKIKDESNIPYAMKFMELWATRFSEAIVDDLYLSYGFDHNAQKEYFEYCMNNTYLPLRMADWRLLSTEEKNAFRNTTDGYIYSGFYSTINTATKHKEVASYVEKAIQEALEWGM